MSDLRLLDAAFNKITSVPSIQPISPIQLILDFNKISEFPADFCRVEDMELFTCVANNLQQFPAFISNMDGGYAIEEIDLTTNKMHGFQNGFKGIRVEKLTMSMNELGKREGDTSVGEFPREFADTKSEINYLAIANNHIDTICRYFWCGACFHCYFRRIGHGYRTRSKKRRLQSDCRRR